MSREPQTMNSQNKLALWAGRISACRNSGQNENAWCKENGVCEQTYYKWQRRLLELEKAQQEVPFVEVTPVHSGNVMEALRLARHKQFDTSSEKSDESLMEQLSFLFNEAEVFAETKAEVAPVTSVAAHKWHKKHEYTLENIPEGMPTRQVEHRLEGEDLVCPECGETMTEIGKEVIRTLEIIPARTVVKEGIYYTYACQRCNQDNIETPVVKAPREKNIIPGSFATPEAVAHIMTQKFVWAALCTGRS